MIIHHFGPDRHTTGGMASVIRLLAESHIGGESVQAHATWRPESRAATMRLTLTAAYSLLRLPSTYITHVHFSEGGSFVREGLLLDLAHKRGLVTVATIHGATFVRFAEKHPRLVTSVLRQADLVTCLDQGALDAVRRSVPQVTTELLPNPVFIGDSVTSADEADELVVFAGEISRRKGADVLLEAWRLVSQRRHSARCLMVGTVTDFPPPPMERLEVRASVGPVEMREILGRARMVVLPSRAEASPMILAEAMSMARPFVSTPVGGIPELAEYGGVLVPVGDALSLADRVTDLLANPDFAGRLGDAGRSYCIATRSVPVIDARLKALYMAAATGKYFERQQYASW